MRLMSKTILVLTYPENPFVNRLWLKGFARYARVATWIVQTVSYARARSQWQKIQDTIRYFQPAGIVSACYEVRLTNGMFGSIPHVWMDAPAEKIPPGDSLVFHDGRATGELAANELLKRDLITFAAVGDQPSRRWSRIRIDEFRRYLQGRGRSVEEFLLSVPFVDRVACMRVLEPWLRRLPKPCGIFAVNDLIASEVVAVADRLGLRIPDDISLVGVDNDEEVCMLASPSLTSIATDWEKGGFMAAETLDRLMRNPSSPAIRVSFGELGVIRRASTSVGPVRVDSRVAEASAFIREHACEGIGVDDVVRQMGCSRSLAMARYLEATGHSIFSEIREAQFAQVMVLLSRRDVQIGAIADRCGWKSPMALRTYFEKRQGLSMREWRKRNVAS